jgi:hypothetical protein
MQTPSIGRIVVYTAERNSPEALPNNTLLMPAIITKVWPDGEVNLKILCDGPQNTWRSCVPYSESEEINTWHWPIIVK